MSNAIKKFLKRLEAQAVRKAALYDGYRNTQTNNQSIDEYMRYLAEEVGEVASAMTRGRLEAAKAECVDVAHTAMLMYLALEVKTEEVNREQ